MPQSNRISSPYDFSVTLFEKMKQINPAMEGLEILEFQYCLENVIPKAGWQSVELETKEELVRKINDLEFYRGIQVSPKVDGQIVLNPQVFKITQMLFVGLVNGDYPVEWVKTHFYFDVRGFIFVHRTNYFTEKVLQHLGRVPIAKFAEKQREFEFFQSVGYKEFKKANLEVDEAFIDIAKKLIEIKQRPVVLAIAGATAAGKTEIVERLSDAFVKAGKRVTSIELDNFFTDRNFREEHGIDSEGKEALHLENLKAAIKEITQGRKITIPRYDFITATSSHDMSGLLRAGATPIEIEPADIIFIEGNFPFLIDEIAHLIGLKVVYLTEDSVRLMRKWKRDVDYRKKYDLNYFRNRFFKDQFIMAQVAYIPQMEICDLVVDTSGAAIWATPEISALLSNQ